MTQTEIVARHLKAGGTLTSLEALQQYGCARLASRIDELRRMGFDIETRLERRGRKRYARYALRGQQEFGL